MLQEDYRKLVLGDADKELPKKIGSPYALCASGCVKLALDWAKGHYPGEPIDFVFEAGGGIPTGELTDWVTRQKRVDPMIRGVSFESKECCPLQAADFHAYEAWKHTESWWSTPELKRQPRKSLESMIEMECIGSLWDASALTWRIDSVRNETDY